MCFSNHVPHQTCTELNTAANAAVGLTATSLSGGKWRILRLLQLHFGTRSRASKEKKLGSDTNCQEPDKDRTSYTLVVAISEREFEEFARVCIAQKGESSKARHRRLGFTPNTQIHALSHAGWLAL